MFWFGTVSSISLEVWMQSHQRSALLILFIPGSSAQPWHCPPAQHGVCMSGQPQDDPSSHRGGSGATAPSSPMSSSHPSISLPLDSRSVSIYLCVSFVSLCLLLQCQLSWPRAQAPTVTVLAVLCASGGAFLSARGGAAGGEREGRPDRKSVV